MTARTLAICADDFGQSPGVSEAIVSLANAGRLSHVSCLVAGPHWRRSAPLLGDLPSAVEVGLHFNLTEGVPLSPALRRVWPRFPSLGGLLAAAHLRALPRQALAAEFAEQWKTFTVTRGQAPDFVDGHQHVHQLPVVRDIVLDAIAESPGIAVRATGRVIGPGFAAKRAVIARSGGRALQRLLRQRGIPHNGALVGVYDFTGDDYATRLRAWLAHLPATGALLFCHPGWPSGDASDPIESARAVEAAYFASDAFNDDLGAAGVTIGPAWQRRAVIV